MRCIFDISSKLCEASVDDSDEKVDRGGLIDLWTRGELKLRDRTHIAHRVDLFIVSVPNRRFVAKC